MRRLLTLAVLGSWVTMMALLVQRQSPSAPALADLPHPAEASARAGEEWFTVERDGQRIGHAHRITSALGEGHRFSEDVALSLTMMGAPQTIQTSMAAETDAAYTLRRFSFTLVSPATTFTAHGTSDGRSLTVAYGTAGEEQQTTLPLGEPIALPSTLRPRVMAGPRTPGTRYVMPVLNPLTLRNEPLTVTVDGRETLNGPDGSIDTVRLVEESQGLRARVWLTDAGDVVREEGTLGFTLVRASRERALAPLEGAATVDLALSARIPLHGTIPDARTRTRLRLAIHGHGDDIPDDPPRQRVAERHIDVEREEPPGPMPRAVLASAARAAGVQVELAPSPFIESDDPAIVATAHEIAGAEADAGGAARALVAWVHEHLKQTPRATVPSAREVLRTRQGDCNEHAVLLAALARASGIPARVAAGALYMEDGFYYHAWTEMWLGRWVTADAVLDQMPADATHVKLVDGGPERHVALAGVVGRLAFTLEETGG